MDIEKSTRHSKIIGNCGEALLCNWFSRSGFEVTLVDHSGIDIVAYHPATGRRLGITVKSRTRPKGREDSPVHILHKNNNDRQKVLDACTAFGCIPWIGVYVESTHSADIYLLSLEHFDLAYRGSPERMVDVWKMGGKNAEKYATDPEVRHIHMDFNNISWEWNVGGV